MVNRRRPSLVAILVALLLAALPGSVAAAAAEHKGAAPDAEVKGAGAGAGRALSREVFGFFTTSERDYMLDVADYGVLSTVAFFAIDARVDGHLALTNSQGTPTAAWAAWNSSWMDNVMARAAEAGTRVVLTIKRFGWSDTERADMVALLSDAGRRALLVDEIADAVALRGDGVNIDFEPMPKEVAIDFVDFIRQLRIALDGKRPGLYLTFDATGYGANYKVAELTASDAADAVFIMGYPFAGGYSDRAGATSPLSGLAYDLTDTVDRFLGQTTPDKIILGVPYYGREWSTTTRYLHSRTRPEGATYGYSVSRRLDGAIHEGRLHGVRWDSEQMVPWTRWRYRACATCPETWRQLYYDNKRSLGLKYDLVNARDLAGVGFWRIGYEGNRPALYQLLRDKFGPPPS
jgi:spore germination protein YaaH